jgi:Transposase DDE domain
MRRFWAARVAEREPRLAAHTQFVFCDHSIERSFSWLGQNRKMIKDYERLTATSEVFVYVAMTRLMLKRLARA